MEFVIDKLIPKIFLSFLEKWSKKWIVPLIFSIPSEIEVKPSFTIKFKMCAQQWMLNKRPCNQSVLKSNFLNKIQPLHHFLNNCLLLKEDNLRSMLWWNINFINASESKCPVCGCSTCTNLLLHNNMLKWKLINVEQKIDSMIKI